MTDSQSIRITTHVAKLARITHRAKRETAWLLQHETHMHPAIANLYAAASAPMPLQDRLRIDRLARATVLPHDYRETLDIARRCARKQIRLFNEARRALRWLDTI